MGSDVVHGRSPTAPSRQRVLPLLLLLLLLPLLLTAQDVTVINLINLVLIALHHHRTTNRDRALLVHDHRIA